MSVANATSCETPSSLASLSDAQLIGLSLSSVALLGLCVFAIVRLTSYRTLLRRRDAADEQRVRAAIETTRRLNHHAAFVRASDFVELGELVMYENLRDEGKERRLSQPYDLWVVFSCLLPRKPDVVGSRPHTAARLPRQLRRAAAMLVRPVDLWRPLCCAFFVSARVRVLARRTSTSRTRSSSSSVTSGSPTSRPTRAACSTP